MPDASSAEPRAGRWWRRRFGRGTSSTQTEAGSRATTLDEVPFRRIADLTLRQEASLSGVLTALAVDADGAPRGLSAQFSDGSGTLTLVWIGRRDVPGLFVGRRLEISGRITVIDNQLGVFNPRYTLLAD